MIRSKVNMNHICNSPLWDSNLTWVTTNPFFTPCFENVVLAPLPFIFIVISTLLNIFASSMFEKLQNAEDISTKRGLRTLTFLTVLKGFTTVSLIGIHAVQLVNTGLRDEHLEVAQSFLSPAVQMIGYIGALTLFVVNFRSNIFNSGVEFGFWLIGTLTQAILFRTAVHVIGGAPTNGVHQIPRLITFPLVFFRLILELLTSRKTAVRRSSDEGVKVHSLPNPDKTSPFLSRILFTWYDKLSLAGYRRTLTSEDLWDLNLKDTSTVQFESLAAKWNRTKDGTLSNVIIPIVKSFGWRYCLAVVMKVGGCGLLLFEPFIVRRLITHVTSDEEESWKGYFYMAVIVTAVSAQAVLTINSDKITQIICMRVKAALSAAVYRKSLLISHAAKTRKDMSVGAMLNLISVDVHKCLEFLIAHHATSAPLIISICTFILYDTLGVAAFIGIGMFGVLMLISNLLTICLGAKYQRQGMQLRDQRIRITSEVLSGIKVLKFYGWEIPFENKIKEVRKEELRCVWKLSWILSLASSICTASPILVAMVTFSWYLLSNPDHTLTPTVAFVLVNIMNILKGYMVVLPSAVISLSQIYVSMKRLNQFFQLEELEAVQGNEIPNSDGKYPVVIDKGSFSWTSDGNPTLKEVTLQIKNGELTAIVGRIGSGKSSLLSAILGEMKKTSGKMDSILDSVAYVSQTPWIQNATLRDNILFGSPYNPDKYQSVINACALIDDIRMLPGGDLVEIGESGTNLSGGQKQRVALARAAYKDASLYLFDDPLSAVDASVGRHIFENLLGRAGILSSKTRLLVTHNTKLLPSVDKIVVLKGGKITECGSYQELLQTQGEFSEFLQTAQEPGISACVDEENDSAALTSLVQLPRKSTVSGKLVNTENAALGNIKFRFYYDYFTSAGFPILFLAVLFFAVSEGMAGYNNFFLAEWSTGEGSVLGVSHNMTLVKRKLVEYILLGCGQGITAFVAVAALTIVCVVATKTLHDTALTRILRCPMYYFDSTLKGTLLSRFARDVEVTDFPILNLIRLVSVLFLAVLITLIMISVTTPLFLVALFPITILYIFLQRFYVSTSRQLKRIESVSRSPIYSHFSETLVGVSTIRAFGVQNTFISECDTRIDANQKCVFAFVVSSLWVTLRLELIGATIIFFTALFVLLGRDGIDPGAAGLALTYAFSTTIHLNLLARLSSDLENNVVSVERLSELTETPQENDWEIPLVKPSEFWPSNGEVSFENYGTRYREGLELVLKGISFEIGAGQKIGVVGRTGAGKSSLALALFRIMEPAQGRIRIDGIDVSMLGLQDLRRRLTIIPQEPLLFGGSLRQNLDPFGQYSDEAQWQALELAHLKTKVGSCTDGLDFKVEEDGKNFSVGERQLICLARALLRRSQILILDEATAAVDGETDDLIQETIRREFASSTVITIAHRLNTILDSDRILVLSRGEIAEFDTPSNLLQDQTSIFSEMVRNANLNKSN